jgi:hypothetical protein
MTEYTYLFESKEDFERMKEKTTKVKVIILDKMDKDVLTNPKFFKQRERTLFLNQIKTYLDTKTDEEIDTEFNEVCNEKLFHKEADFNKYPIYDLSKPILQKEITESA